MEEILKKLKPLLDHHREIAVEFDERGLCVLLKKVRPNLLGNFAGGDMAYAANAAAGLLCVAEDRLAETASLPEVPPQGGRQTLITWSVSSGRTATCSRPAPPS